jgi:hypothetical protein
MIITRMMGGNIAKFVARLPKNTKIGSSNLGVYINQFSICKYHKR